MEALGFGRKVAPALASSIIKRLNKAAYTSARALSGGLSVSEGIVGSEVVTSHTAKRMQDTSKKSPMELINEVPPIKVEGRIVACEGDNEAALGHPIEFIRLDLEAPAVCKYCGLRYVQDHHHH